MTAKYANKTCCNCGIRKPQPEMVRKQVEVEVGKSTTTVTPSTFFGAGLGDKGAQRAIARAGFNSGQRTYTRKQTKWFCYDCAYPARSALAKPVKKVAKIGTKPEEKVPLWVWIFWGVVLISLLSMCSG